MFQTDIIIFLQSFSSDGLNTFFLFITGLGDESIIQAILIVLLFGIHFRAGFLLLQLILINAIATGFFKNFFALPRPFNLDAAVRTPGYTVDPNAVISGKGVETFWAMPPEDILRRFRMHPPNSFGFPSGHTSSAIALWGGIALFFKKWWIAVPCLLLIFLIPLSRLYLGRHFPADILGGYALGGLLLFLFHRYAFENTGFKNFLFQKITKPGRVQSLTVMAGFLIPALLIGLSIQPEYSAMWLGLNIGFFLVRRKGVPDDGAPVRLRMGRVLLAGGFFYGLDRLAAPLVDWCEASGADLRLYLVITLLLTLFIWLSTETMVRLGWMCRPSPSPLWQRGEGRVRGF